MFSATTNTVKELSITRDMGFSKCLEMATRRLRIAATGFEDTSRLLELLRDHRVSRWFLEPPAVDEQDARAALVQGLSTWEAESRFHCTAFFECDPVGTSAVIGGACLLDHEISYYIDPSMWGQGYGYELVEGLCTIARDQLDRNYVYARVLRENVRSRRVLERLGFEFRGLVYQLSQSGNFRHAVLRYALQLCHNGQQSTGRVRGLER
jgi:[ribosomal protein S5]-alanine N-acetyltransferase